MLAVTFFKDRDGRDFVQKAPGLEVCRLAEDVELKFPADTVNKTSSPGAGQP